MQSFWEIEENNETGDFYPTISAQETNKQTNEKITEKTNNQSNLLIITISCEKRSYLIRSKKNKQNKTSKTRRKKIKQNKKGKKTDIGNNSKSGYVEKKKNNQRMALRNH